MIQIAIAAFLVWAFFKVKEKTVILMASLQLH